MPVSLLSPTFSSSCPLFSSSFVSKMSRTSLPSLPFAEKPESPFSTTRGPSSSSSSEAIPSPSDMIPRAGWVGAVGGFPPPGGAIPPVSLTSSFFTILGGPLRADWGRSGAPPRAAGARLISCRSGSASGSGFDCFSGFSDSRRERPFFSSFGLSSAFGFSSFGSSFGFSLGFSFGSSFSFSFSFSLPSALLSLDLLFFFGSAGSSIPMLLGGGAKGGSAAAGASPGVSPAKTRFTASAPSDWVAIFPSICRNAFVFSGSSPATTF
mmetsp:Transcript_39612/g.66501  ORF Transcript_39612/g.66501 Transcript_39612/m.66501 type:complete len:266 (-) Transcript_39612:341-1138(-)